MIPTPKFDLGYDGDEWSCPLTRAGPVPKLIETNLVYRANLFAKAANDVELQQALLNVCAKSPLYFVRNSLALAGSD